MDSGCPYRVRRIVANMKNKENRKEDHRTTDNMTTGDGTTDHRITDHGTTEHGATGRETAEEWWARISPTQRGLARVIAGMMREMTATKRVEIRWDGSSVRARFIHVLENPEPGCVSAIVLPERASGGWN
jgi:hypothetical protein